MNLSGQRPEEFFAFLYFSVSKNFFIISLLDSSNNVTVLLDWSEAEGEDFLFLLEILIESYRSFREDLPTPSPLRWEWVPLSSSLHSLLGVFIQ